MGGEDGLDRRTLSRAIKRFEPVWELRRAQRIGTGPLAVYRVTVEAPGGETTWILKATPGSSSDRIGTEARLLSMLADTAIPVPAVRGLIDEDPDLPTPLVLLNELSGRTIGRAQLVEIDVETLEALAYQSGEYLAALHRLDVVDRFGYLGPSGATRNGDVPPADSSAIEVVRPESEWRDRLHTDLEPVIAEIEDGPFADLADAVRGALERRIEELVGPFSPVLARIDHSIENLRVLGDRIVGVLDWEFTLAATPGYDLEYVVWSLAGGPWLYGMELPDRRETIREHVIAGYIAAGGPGDPEQARSNRSCYELVIAARSMQLLDEWFELFDFDVSPDRGRAALRADVKTLIER